MKTSSEKKKIIPKTNSHKSKEGIVEDPISAEINAGLFVE